MDVDPLLERVCDAVLVGLAEVEGDTLADID